MKFLESAFLTIFRETMDSIVSSGLNGGYEKIYTGFKMHIIFDKCILIQVPRQAFTTLYSLHPKRVYSV